MDECIFLNREKKGRVILLRRKFTQKANYNRDSSTQPRSGWMEFQVQRKVGSVTRILNSQKIQSMVRNHREEPRLTALKCDFITC